MSAALYSAIVEATRKAIATDASQVPLHEPSFRGNELPYVSDCVKTGWVSYAGSYVNRFERMLAEFTGAREAVVVANGTVALQLACTFAGVEPGDEVLVPALTFVATANAVVHAGAIPHFVESESRSFGVDAALLRDYLGAISEKRNSGLYNRQTGRRIKALILMHVFGHPADTDAVGTLCRELGIELIEDAAESLGSFYRGKHTGRLGKISTLSFNGNKVVTTGGGGALLMEDPDLAAHARHLTTTAKVKHPWAFFHDEVGYNFRLPNLNAALGCAQMESLPESLKRKRALAERYFRAFEGIPGVRIHREPEYGKSNYWLNTLVLDRADLKLRDGLLEYAHSRGILARPVWTLMHRLPMYQSNPRMPLPVAEDLEARLINLPSGSQLGGET